MYGLTDGMQLIADCFASLERIEAFLLIEELNGNGKGNQGNQGEETTGNEDGDEDAKDKKDSTEKSFLKVQFYFILSREIFLVYGKQIVVFLFRTKS